MSSIFAELRKEIPYRWKVQTSKQWGCECVAYIDARQVMDLLDDVMGPGNWQDEYRNVAGNVYCDLSIRIGDEWVSKSDCGTESTFESAKGQASDAFKRAAVKWGIGRFLYRLDSVRLKSVDLGNGKYAPADDNGRRIYNLTAYIRALQNKPETPKDPLPPEPKAQTTQPAPTIPKQGQGLSKIQTQQTTIQVSANLPAMNSQKEMIKTLMSDLGFSKNQFHAFWAGMRVEPSALNQGQANRAINELEKQKSERRQAMGVNA